jgi:CheY-like chemotaxis protein
LVERLRVLVVDDTRVSRDVLREAIARRGCSVDVAVDGDEAVRVCRATDYDLVLMDRRMPPTDGIVAAHLIRAEAAPHKPPRIVLLTADPTARGAPDEGDVDAFVEKPISMRSLDALLAHVARGDEDLVARALIDNRLDSAVLADLRATPHAGGGTVFDRIALRVIDDNRALVESLTVALRRDARDGVSHAAHRIAGNALLVGDRATARLANDLEAHRRDQRRQPEHEAPALAVGRRVAGQRADRDDDHPSESAHELPLERGTAIHPILVPRRAAGT